MKRLIAILLTMLFVVGLVSFASAEYTMPGDGYNLGTIGTDGKPFRLFIGNTLVLSGATDDAYETHIYAVEPTAYNVIAVPNESGTLVTTGSTDAITNGMITAGTDGYVMISNDVGTGTVIWAAHTLTGDVTGTMLNSGALAATITPGTDGQILISNNSGGGEVVWATVSSDATIANSGALTIAANAVGTNEANINSVALMIGSGSTANSVVVESGATLMGWYLSNGPGAVTAKSNYINTVEWDGSTFKVTLNTTGVGATEITGTFLRP